MDRVGVYVRGRSGAESEDTVSRLAPFAEVLTQRLDTDFNEQSDYLFLKSLDIDMQAEANWARAAEWLTNETNSYERALRDIVR